MTVEAECKACDGQGFTMERNNFLSRYGLHETNCHPCNGTGWLECGKGGVNCPHPQQCICEAAWERQEADKMSDG